MNDEGGPNGQPIEKQEKPEKPPVLKYEPKPPIGFLTIRAAKHDRAYNKKQRKLARRGKR